MEFLEDLETLEEMFEQHKLDNRDIQDFRQNVDECIARQVWICSAYGSNKCSDAACFGSTAGLSVVLILLRKCVSV